MVIDAMWGVTGSVRMLLPGLWGSSSGWGLGVGCASGDYELKSWMIVQSSNFEGFSKKIMPKRIFKYYH